LEDEKERKPRHIAENIRSFKKNVTKNYRGGKILLR
jgi:hypothetical protein